MLEGVIVMFSGNKRECSDDSVFYSLLRMIGKESTDIINRLGFFH